MAGHPAGNSTGLGGRLRVTRGCTDVPATHFKLSSSVLLFTPRSKTHFYTHKSRDFPLVPYKWLLEGEHPCVDFNFMYYSRVRFFEIETRRPQLDTATPPSDGLYNRHITEFS